MKKDIYSASGLRDWLKHDTWTAKEALLLFSDISPKGALVEWGGWRRI